MGKARILQALGEGRYTIEIIEARERAEVAKQQALARITQLQTQVNALTQQINAAQSAFAAAVNEQNAAIAQYQQEMAEEGSSSINLAETAEKVMTTAGARDKLRVEQRSLEVRIKADEALIARINSLPPLRQMQAWCADYTDDLSGEVATAEVPGEIGSVIIKPGFEGANQWSATADGAMQPALASTPAATFYNLAMLPGWQKWRPTYRTATITSINGDTCSIALDAATSSQQELNVNASSNYSGVPILYMDCNGAAFEQGDKVLVAFAGNINGPTVVGFESAPRVCCEPEVLAESPSQGETWSVRSLYGTTVIKGGMLAEWRIINANTDEVIYSGGVTQGEDGYLLADLPETVDLLSSNEWEHEIISSAVTTVSSGVTSGDYWTTLDAPARIDYAGGRFAVRVRQSPPDENTFLEPVMYSPTSSGFISSQGQPIDETGYPWPVGYLLYDDWPEGETHYAYLVYWRQKRALLKLEKGCNGEWPEQP